MTDKEQVNHPDHYQHPSGIECYQISMYLNAPAAQAFQYLFRRHHKGNELEDCRKALWWLEMWSLWFADLPNLELSSAQVYKLGVIAGHEESEKIREVYWYLGRVGSLTTQKTSFGGSAASNALLRAIGELQEHIEGATVMRALLMLLWWLLAYIYLRDSNTTGVYREAHRTNCIRVRR